jgi:hypothetical protein
MLTLALLYILASASSHSETTLVPVVLNAQTLTVEVTVTWNTWPTRVYVRARDLYTQPLPTCPVRFVGKCRARSLSGYMDLWDGYTQNKVRRGIRVYMNTPDGTPTDCRSYINGVNYIVDGWTDRLGRIYATEVRSTQ